jgi:hypothetical protein
VYLQALTFYIASRATNSMGLSGEFHAGNNYAKKFEAEVTKLTALNYDLDENSEQTKLESRGFA